MTEQEPAYTFTDDNASTGYGAETDHVKLQRHLHHMLDIACVHGSVETMTVIERVRVALADRESYQKQFINAMRRCAELREDISTHEAEIRGMQDQIDELAALKEPMEYQQDHYDHVKKGIYVPGCTYCVRDSKA